MAQRGPNVSAQLQGIGFPAARRKGRPVISCRVSWRLKDVPVEGSRHRGSVHQNEANVIISVQF